MLNCQRVYIYIWITWSCIKQKPWPPFFLPMTMWISPCVASEFGSTFHGQVARMAQMNKPCFHAIKNHAVKAADASDWHGWRLLFSSPAEKKVQPSGWYQADLDLRFLQVPVRSLEFLSDLLVHGTILLYAPCINGIPWKSYQHLSQKSETCR